MMLMPKFQKKSDYVSYFSQLIYFFNSSLFFFTNEILFLQNYSFLFKLKTSLEACFLWHNSYILTDRLSKQKQLFGDVFQIGVLKNFAIITEKNLCWNPFFDKVVELKPCSFILIRPQHRCFHENIGQFSNLLTPGGNKKVTHI